MTNSEAAKARGVVGFLHPIRRYAVKAGHVIVFAGRVKKDAWAAARRWLKNSADPHGEWFGVKVTFTIDGKPVPRKLVASNYHPAL